jgi:plastocyanin
MRARWLPLVALIGFAVAVVPALASNQSVQAGPGVAFSPNEIAVKPGETVTFSNAGGFHSVVFDNATPFNGGADASNGAPSSSAWSATATFPAEGRFTFHCGYHGVSMTGTVNVNSEGTVPGSSETIPGPTTTTGTTTAPTTSTPTTTTPTVPTTTGADTRAPSLANLSLARSFRVRSGVTLDMTVSELATIQGTLLKRPLRKAKGRFKQFGTLRFVVRIAGDNRFRFTKTREGRRLQRGSYRLKLVATDGADNRSKARTVSFTVR